MQNPPILRDGLENADLFPMSGPASWCFLIPKRFCKEVSTHSKKKKKVHPYGCPLFGARFQTHVSPFMCSERTSSQDDRSPIRGTDRMTGSPIRGTDHLRAQYERMRVRLVAIIIVPMPYRLSVTQPLAALISITLSTPGLPFHRCYALLAAHPCCQWCTSFVCANLHFLACQFLFLFPTPLRRRPPRSRRPT